MKLKIKDKTKQVLDGIESLIELECLVGVPSQNNPRNDGPVTNAEIGITNEFGNPRKRIPARPHLRPGVAGAEKAMEPYFKAATIAALEGRKEQAANHLLKAGRKAVANVVAAITKGIPPPLSRMSLEARAGMSKRGRKAAKLALKQLNETGAYDPSLVTPLIITGQYRRSITALLAKRGQHKKVR